MRKYAKISEEMAQAAMHKAQRLTMRREDPLVSNGSRDHHEIAFAGFAGEYALAALLLADWRDIDTPIQADYRGRCDLYFGGSVECKTTFLYNPIMRRVLEGANHFKDGTPICGLVPEEQFPIAKESDVLVFMAIDQATKSTALVAGWIHTEEAFRTFDVSNQRLGSQDYYPNRVLQVPYEALRGMETTIENIVL